MQQFGAASVYGVAGTITGIAYVIPESVESENTASIDEFKSGINQLLGFYKTDERIVLDMVLTPKADTIAHANTSLAFPAGPLKVTLSGFPDDGSGSSPNRQINGDYVYLQGARKTLVRGQASFRLQVFRPLDLPGGVTIDTLVTLITS
jgi:hypothetical protein